MGWILGNNLAAKGRLNEFELIQAQASDSTVVGVFDLLAVAEGGAQDADGFGAMSLDLEMDWTDRFKDGYRLWTLLLLCQELYKLVYGYI